MRTKRFRIHGDNIVECQRTLDYICNGLLNPRIEYSFVSSACPKATVFFDDDVDSELSSWEFVMFPGFNKANTTRWPQDIYEPLRRRGGFLRETPDALVTRLSSDGRDEEILFAVEYCSALQAGNQAWQRSGRALSTARSGCPYLYVVDFVNHELNPETRQPKGLRFPNPVVPYSFISQTHHDGTFCMQVYVRAEEFQQDDSQLRTFDTRIFGKSDFEEYMVRKLSGVSTATVESRLTEKCFDMVKFLSPEPKNTTAGRNLSRQDWQNLYDEERSGGGDLIDYSTRYGRLPHKKTVARRSIAPGHHGTELCAAIAQYANGIGTANLPFGVVPETDVENLRLKLSETFTAIDFSSIPIDEPLLVCLLKGFKPRGDDDRPDRGALPLLRMLSGKNRTLMTYVYGPILRKSLMLLHNNPQTLAQRNGLWNALLCHSDFLLLDSPVLPASTNPNDNNDIIELIDNRPTKRALTTPPRHSALRSPAISEMPVRYKEDDVDTALHIMLADMTPTNVREGLCNPPGGDWSGLSLFKGDTEYRWMSLPRVSGDRKRPDHVAQFDGVDDYPVVLITESKGRADDLEQNIDFGLEFYLRELLNYPPNVYRDNSGNHWIPCTDVVDFDDYRFVTAGAFLGNTSVDVDQILDRSGCSLLFVFTPCDTGWLVDIHARTEIGHHLATYIESLFVHHSMFKVTKHLIPDPQTDDDDYDSMS